MAWSPKQLRGNKKPSTKILNYENKVEGGDELQKLTPIVEGTSLKVTTHTQVVATLACVALENNHLSMDASSSLLGDGREERSQHHPKEQVQEHKICRNPTLRKCEAATHTPENGT
jgi:hypothetical protein